MLPHRFKGFNKSILVLLNKKFLTRSLDPGNKHDAVMKNAAEDGSPELGI